jgi:hypothetical protein
MLRVKAMRTACLERHNFEIAGLRSKQGGNTPARERVQRFERVMGRLAGAQVC